MTTNFLVLTAILPTLLFASGEYKPKPYKPDPYKPKTTPHNWDTSTYKPADKNYKYQQGAPHQRKETDLKEYVFSIPRKKVTINNFDYQQATFTLKGTYKTEAALNQFLERLKASIRSKNKLDIKKHQTNFAGSKTFHYEVTADNQF